MFGTLNKAYKELEKIDQPKFVFWAGQEFEAPEEIQKFTKSYNADMFSFKQLTTIGGNQEESLPTNLRKTQPSDLALIMYTSGSTGSPKGVELTHANIAAACGGAQHLIAEILVGFNHTYIGYLPLAHVLEFIIELTMISLAIPIGYGSVRTLMNEFVCGPDGQGQGLGDLKALKPSILIGVPAVWERIKKGVEGQLDEKHWAVKKVFETAIEFKWDMLQYFGKSNVVTDAYDALFFGALRDATGGNLKFCFTGGAPVSYETQKFITSTLALMLQGYGYA